MLPNKNWTLGGLKMLLRKIDATNSVERCSGSGRPRTVRVPDMIANVQDLVLSQENAPKTHSSQRRIFHIEQEFHWGLSTELFAMTCVWHALIDAGRMSWRMPARSLDENPVLISVWSTVQSGNGARDCKPAWQLMENISNINCEHAHTMTANNCFASCVNKAYLFDY